MEKGEFITFDRVNNRSIIWSKRNATYFILESLFGLEWVLTGKLALCLSFRRCRSTRIPILKSAGAFCEEDVPSLFREEFKSIMVVLQDSASYHTSIWTMQFLDDADIKDLHRKSGGPSHLIPPPWIKVFVSSRQGSYRRNPYGP